MGVFEMKGLMTGVLEGLAQILRYIEMCLKLTCCCECDTI